MHDACVRRPREFELVSHASAIVSHPIARGTGDRPCRPVALVVASLPGICLKIKNFTERSLSPTAWATGACRPQMGDRGLFLQFIETAIYF